MVRDCRINGFSRGKLFAWEVRFREVILKGDNIYVMNAIHLNEAGFFSGGVIVADINQMGLSCNRVSFSFVKR